MSVTSSTLDSAVLPAAVCPDVEMLWFLLLLIAHVLSCVQRHCVLIVDPIALVMKEQHLGPRQRREKLSLYLLSNIHLVFLPFIFITRTNFSFKKINKHMMPGSQKFHPLSFHSIGSTLASLKLFFQGPHNTQYLHKTTKNHFTCTNKLISIYKIKQCSTTTIQCNN